MSNENCQTFNIKKSQKRQAKKRKLEAFLNLVRDSDSTPTKTKKTASTFAESYKALKDELKKYQKKKEVDPVFYLTNAGNSARVNFLVKDKELSSKSPIFSENFYHLLLKSVLGNISPFPLQWAKLEQANSINKTVVVEIEHLSEQNIIEMNSSFIDNFLLPTVFEVVSTDQAFASELCYFHLRSDYCGLAEKNYSYMFPVDELSVTEPEIEVDNKQNKISKLHLLLSPIQMALEHYPLPQNVFYQSKSDGYCFSKKAYTPVHADSPMFAIDCEMCKTITGKQEVTRIAIVDESLETVYHTLVKPEAEIVDYVTRFSGITEKMLRDVKTTLTDVQKDIQNLLPSDAILCGQSLNCDLHGLKMIHPYCIDTSVIYNEHGIRQKKTSLKQLALIHLKESIQDGKKGHNPIEDSIATMKLVQLKLKHSLVYGDAVLSSDTDKCNESVPDNEINNYASSQDCGFFTTVSRFSKKVCLIGNESSLNSYSQTAITDKVTKINKSSLTDIMKATVENLEGSDLTISHLIFNAQNNSVTELNDELKQLHNSCPNKTLFIVFMSDIKKSSDQYFRHNFCMVTLKAN